MPQDNEEYQALISGATETKHEREGPGNANYQSLLNSHIWPSVRLYVLFHASVYLLLEEGTGPENC
jgi:hypothetical protein